LARNSRYKFARKAFGTVWESAADFGLRSKSGVANPAQDAILPHIRRRVARANSDPPGRPKIAPPVWVAPGKQRLPTRFRSERVFALADARFIADQKT